MTNFVKKVIITNATLVLCHLELRTCFSGCFMSEPDSRLTVEKMFWFYRKKIALAVRFFRPRISYSMAVYISIIYHAGVYYFAL